MDVASGCRTRVGAVILFSCGATTFADVRMQWMSAAAVHGGSSGGSRPATLQKQPWPVQKGHSSCGQLAIDHVLAVFTLATLSIGDPL